VNSPHITRTVEAFADTLINKNQNYKISKTTPKAWIGDLERHSSRIGDKSDKFLEKHKTLTDSKVGREQKLSIGRFGKSSTMDRLATFLAEVETPKSCGAHCAHALLGLNMTSTAVTR
jgi:hypothetical protein